jgi:flagellar FliL protein
MKLIIIIALAAVIVIGGGVGGFLYWRSLSAATTETAGKKPTEKKSAKTDTEKSGGDGETGKTDKKAADSIKNTLPKDEGVKKIVEMPPFIVNLADADQARYLRMSVSLGIEGEAASEKPDTLFTTRIRNAMLAVLSEKKSEDILTSEGKAKLRKELLAAAQAASEEPFVAAIYITDFIVQL